MKKFLLALATTAMVASPLVSAQAQAAPHRETVRVVKEGPRGRTVVKQRTVVRNDHRDWRKGDRFDRRYAANYRVIDNPRAYRLNSAPRGYHWVRSGNDAVLVAIASGVIGAVIGNAIR
jgi:Ni/Co efflux regulator RcnB